MVARKGIKSPQFPQAQMASAIEIFASELNKLAFLENALFVDCGIDGVYTIEKAQEEIYFYCSLNNSVHNKFNKEQIMDFFKVLPIQTITVFNYDTEEEQDVYRSI